MENKYLTFLKTLNGMITETPDEAEINKIKELAQDMLPKDFAEVLERNGIKQINIGGGMKNCYSVKQSDRTLCFVN